MKPQSIEIAPLTIRHREDQIDITHSGGLTVSVSESRLLAWAMGLLRKQLTPTKEVK